MLKDKDEDKPPLLWLLNVAAVDDVVIHYFNL
jgi:hypothetical protein